MAEDVVASIPPITSAIVHVRGHRVILDASLASLYGVTTKRLNEQVRRNLKRFPADFMFQMALVPPPSPDRARAPPRRDFAPR